MKKTILKKDRRGFTLAELLAVFLILVILIGLGVPGFIALRKNIKIAEYDDIAREIYLAAQNQLTRLSANGMDKETGETLSASGLEIPFTEQPSDFDSSTGVTWDSTEYRHASQGTDCMTLLLPLGAVSEDIRTNGFYTIEYNVKTYTVYGVFYSEKKFEYYDDVKAADFRTSRDVRKGPMVGYYGGSAVRQNPQNYCETPQLEIINNNELKLIIKKGLENIDRSWVTVTVTDGIHTPVTVSSERIVQEVSDQSYTVLMDSILKSGSHFKDLFPELTPGKDLTVTVTFNKPGYLPSSATISTNSLFATREPGAGDNGGDVVTVAWARHLQNLEHAVSNLNDQTIATARQTDHIQWIQSEFGDFTSIRNQDETAEYNKNLLRYEGSSLEIRDLTGENGLFAQTKENMELSGIRLVNPNIQAPAGSTEPVGGLVGTAKQGTKIDSCGVYYSKTNTDGTVGYNGYKNCGITNDSGTATGGLAGKAENISVNSSFAALTFIEAEKGAGLIGDSMNSKITGSYANCDSLPTSNFRYFIGGTGNTVDNSYAVGNVANSEDGVFAGNGNTVKNSYYAVSHKDFAANTDLSATEFYYAAETENVWQKTDRDGMANATDPDGWASGWKKLTAPVSHPYREILDGRAYPYPAIAHASLGAMDHYGSWPEGDGTVKLTVNMELLNSSDSVEDAGTVVITVPVPGGAPKVIYDSDDPENFPSNEINVAPGTEITVTASSKEGYEYVNTQVLQKISTVERNSYPITKDTTVTVRFRQKAFALRCHYPEDLGGNFIEGASYFVDLTSPVTTLAVRRYNSSGRYIEKSVETGSEIVVRPARPTSYAATVAYYEVDGKKTYITQGTDGYFTFDMPAKDTDLHIIYTKEKADYNIRYHLMNSDGTYKNAGTFTYTYGIGAQINHDMIAAMAESSGLLLVVDGEEVRYLAEGIVSRENGTEIFRTTIDENGSVTSTDPYVTESGDKDKTFNVDIYIARRKYSVTLIAGDYIKGVRFSGETGERSTVTREYYYGADVTAVAVEEPGYSLTFWDPKDPRFMMSANKEYAFTVPHFDLKLTATAKLGEHLVTINLEENDESWLYSSESRQLNPVHLTLVSTKDGREYPMTELKFDSISYAMQAVVPTIPDYEEGYNVRVNYDKPNPTSETWIFASGGEDTDENNEKLLIPVREGAVEKTVKFYSVTYHPRIEKYYGSPPDSGTYPMYYHLKVEGNSGYLRNADKNDLVNRFFSGWKDYDAEGTGSPTLFTGSEILMITRKTDMFAQWLASLNVVYDGNGADGGTLPVDNNNYQVNDLVAVKFGKLTRKGYIFLGWSKDKEAKEAEYSQGGVEEFQLNSTPVTLYAVWKQEEYSLKFYDHEGAPLSDDPYQKPKMHYGDTFDAPPLTVTLPNGEHKEIVGWSLTQGGDVAYHVNDTVTVTGNMTFYACLAEEPVTVTYKSMDGYEAYGTQSFGIGIPSYLSFVPTISGQKTPVTAWSREPEGKGTLYFCREDGRSEEAYAFPEDTTLYAVTGKVYNYQQQMWFNTLGEAVRDDATSNGHTLIVYRDTKEPVSVVFDKSLYVLASGNRKVTWKEDAENGNGDLLTEEGEGDANEFVGCMKVKGCTVQLGYSDVSTLSMKGSSLTFDANKQSRVISIGNSSDTSILHMYDGVTLTNGYRPKVTISGNSAVHGKTLKTRTFCGGGVYAGDKAEFYMHGGTVSYCEAVSGGGVYLLYGSKMYMGDMVKPKAYSATATYYHQVPMKYNDGRAPEDVYQIVEGVTAEDYQQYWIASGNPSICYNTSTQDWDRDGGGGLLMLDLNNGDLTLFCGSITNNTTSGNGGGIMTDSKANNCYLRIYEVDISHNTADTNGGGIYQWQGTLYIYNSTIRQNKAKNNGGGIYLREQSAGVQTSDIEFYYGDIAYNEATQGGGVYADFKCKFTLDGGNLFGNTATDSGGGIYLQYYNNIAAVLEMRKGTITGNEAKNNGGGVFSLGEITITGGTMSGNTAGNYAGGIYNDRAVSISGGTLCDNQARFLGGGIYSKGRLNLSGGCLYGNTDTDYRDARADEDNATYGANDIYLEGDHKITVPNGGITLSGEYRVTVDCDNDASARFDGKQLPRHIVEYDRAGDYEPADDLYFTYYGTRSGTKYVGVDLSVISHRMYSPEPATGLYLDVKLEGTKRTVTLNSNYPKGPDPYRLEGEVNQEILLEKEGGPVFTRTGYYIAGWARNANALEEEYVLLYDPAEGKWKSDYGNKIWNTISVDPKYTVQDYFSQTLYAMWKPCTVAYELLEEAKNNGVTIQPTSVGPVVTLMNPEPVEYTENGITYRFKGWSEDPDRKNVDHFVTDQLTLEQNLRLYDVWEARAENSVIITLWYNGGSSTKPGELGQVITVPKGESVPLPSAGEITWSGKILLGWSPDKNAVVPAYQEGITLQSQVTDQTLYAVWVDAVELVFNLNYEGADKPSTVSLVKGEKYTIRAAPSRPYGKFLGWSTEIDPVATAKLYKEGEEFGPVEGDTTLYAIWEMEQWTLTLDPNDGSGSKTQHTAIKGTSIPLTPPTREGYDFQGWSETEDGTLIAYAPDVTDLPYADSFGNQLTLYAVWKEAAYTVTFDGNGCPEDFVPEAVTVIKGDSIQKLPEIEWKGHEFRGWAREKDATNRDFRSGEEFTPDGQTTLYAVWKRVTVKFDLKEIKVINPPDSITVLRGESVELPELVPVDQSYVFLGWDTSKQANTVVYKAGDKFMPGKSITLRAVWDRNRSANSASPTEEQPSALEPNPPVTESQPLPPAGTDTVPETAQPETEAVTADPESGPTEPETWEVSFCPDGGDLTENAMLEDEPLQDPLWDEEEDFFTYTVPIAEDVTILPPELEREGYLLAGWMWMDEEEPDPDKWEIYPAGEEIPITGNMKWLPVWIEEELPAVEAEVQSEPLPSEAFAPPETEAPTVHAPEPPKPQEPEPPVEPETEPPTQPETETEPSVSG